MYTSSHPLLWNHGEKNVKKNPTQISIQNFSGAQKANAILVDSWSNHLDNPWVFCSIYWRFGKASLLNDHINPS